VIDTTWSLGVGRGADFVLPDWHETAKIMLANVIDATAVKCSVPCHAVLLNVLPPSRSSSDELEEDRSVLRRSG
jgi:hypothetical protein